MLLRHGDASDSFERAIQETISLGGDTDTNACIVGGMMGALIGKDRIPEEMKGKVLNCDVKQGGQPNRPKFIQVKVAFETSM